MSTTFMNMVINVSGGGLAESSEVLQPSIMLYRELEKGKECLSESLKGTTCPIVFIDIPFGCDPREVSLKEVYVNWVFSDAIGGAPKIK